jgi:hypothetical protein
MVGLIKIFDVVQLKKTHPEFQRYWDDNAEYIKNDYGRQYFVNKDYVGGWDEKNIYADLDNLLVNLGADRGEWVMFWFSW